jgi:HSP20 family molecular chaperone IbpA
MAALLPRVFGDTTDWLEPGFPLFGGQLIRVEDRLTDDAYILCAELPGVDPEKDVEVTVANGVLTIQAERREELSATGRSEFRYGTLYRTVRLPANADKERITATYTNGVLEVTVPLTAREPAGKQIPVTSAG